MAPQELEHLCRSVSAPIRSRPRSRTANCGETFEDVFRAAICRSVAAGVTYTAAAGNSSANTALVAPAGYREVIAVSGLGDFDGRAGGAAVRRAPAGGTSVGKSPR